MAVYFEPIKTALILFPIIAFLITLPYLIIEYHKYGAVSLAKKMNVPIIPFGISGRYDGSGIITHIGKAFYVNDMELGDANILLRNKILELMEK